MLNTIFDKKIKFVNDLTKLSLKGQVKELKVRFLEELDPKYNHDNKKYFLEHQREIWKDMYFDSMGNLREVNEYKNSDLIDIKRIFNYNDRNQLVSKIFQYSDNLNFFEYSYIYTFNRIKVYQKFNDSKNELKKILYIKNREIVKINELNGEWASIKNSISLYENDQLIETDFVFGKQKLYYDNNRLMIVKNFLQNTDNCLSSEYYFYKDNILISSLTFENDGADLKKYSTRSIYESDNFGNWIRKTTTNIIDSTVIKVFRKLEFY